MDEQALIHRLSVDYNLNIELLKDLLHDDKLFTMIKSNKKTDAILYLRKTYQAMDLGVAKNVVDEFSNAFS